MMTLNKLLKGAVLMSGMMLTLDPYVVNAMGKDDFKDKAAQESFPNEEYERVYKSVKQYKEMQKQMEDHNKNDTEQFTASHSLYVTSKKIDKMSAVMDALKDETDKSKRNALIVSLYKQKLI